jgi:iron complex transport system substrate-binding protein
LGTRTLALKAGSLNGIFDDIRAVGEAIGKEAAGVIDREQKRLNDVKARASIFRRPTVVMLEWTDPLFVMGNWGPELVEFANGDLLLSTKGQYSSTITAAQLSHANPEYLIVAPCGFSLPRALKEQPVLESLPGWRKLEAVKNGRVAIADGNLFFNRSGMTVSPTAEIIAEILHSQHFGAPPESWKWLRHDDLEPSTYRPIASFNKESLP